tara:strand:+ start:1658 stop:2206 length:549 start_codon:yes stop_codon:yes gene_type:complete
MAGIIEQNMTQPIEGAPAQGAVPQQGAVPEQGAAPEQGTSISPQAIKENTKMPPKLQNAYDRVVLAGMKIMFSEKTNELVMKQMQGDGPVSERLGIAIAGLMATLFKESNQTMPPAVVIPAGVYLLAQAAEFLKKSQLENIDDKGVGDAMQIFVETTIKMFGGDSDKVYSILNGFSNQNVGG